MALADSTQFFQFDSKGNMYIYAPGAGCTGEAKLVTPGDELIFSNSTQWEEKQSPLLSNVSATSEQAVPLTCPVADTAMGVCPFKEPLAAVELSELSHKNFSPDTLKKVRWAVKMYCEWRIHRHSMGLERITCNLDDRATITGTSLHFDLCRFLTEVKKIDGSDFPGKTLYDIAICIQFHLECLGFTFKVIND